MAACQRAEEEKTAEHRRISESDFKVVGNKAFMGIITPLDDFLSKRDDTNIENNELNDWKDELGENKPISET